MNFTTNYTNSSYLYDNGEVRHQHRTKGYTKPTPNTTRTRSPCFFLGKSYRVFAAAPKDYWASFILWLWNSSQSCHYFVYCDYLTCKMFLCCSENNCFILKSSFLLFANQSNFRSLNLKIEPRAIKLEQLNIYRWHVRTWHA